VDELDERILYGSQSPCHQRRSIIVRSRSGGFVTQNCEYCGKPRALQLSELPDLSCGGCGKTLERYKTRRGNYAYRCRSCARTHVLAYLVPSWAELFDEHGYAIEPDEAMPDERPRHGKKRRS
jgi:hypothetical protein